MGSCSSDPMMMFAFYNSWTRRWLRSPSPEAQSLEQWGHWKSVVVITAEAALQCLSLATVIFWHWASSKLACHFGLSMAYLFRSLGLMWHHLRLALTVSLYRSFGLPWFLLLAWSSPYIRRLCIRHSSIQITSNPLKLGLDDSGLYAGGISLIEDLLDWLCGPATWFPGWSGELACERAPVS